MIRTVKQTQVVARQGRLSQFKGDLVILGLYADTQVLPGAYSEVDSATGGAVGNLLKLKDFLGSVNETAVVYAVNKAPFRRVMLMGLGDSKTFRTDLLRQAVGTAIRQSDKLSAGQIGLGLPEMGLDAATIGQAASEGAIVGRYNYQEYVTGKNGNGKSAGAMTVTLLDADTSRIKKLNEGIQVGSILAEGQNLARMLGNKPGNEINPPTLACEVQSLAKKYGLKCKVFDDRQLAKMKMNGILAVGNGSASKPRLIMLEYNGRKNGGKNKSPDVVVVGKAVTFDSGGIDIKPIPKMELMKHDKSGGCDTVGILAAAAKLKLKKHIIGLIPSAENLLSSTCWRPGDIVTTYSGKTVEILSTDAEGRMLLADAITYATQMKPGAIIDMATLTGACAIALGEIYAGLFSNDENLAGRIQQAAERSGEGVWRMPCGSEYLEFIKSKIADLKNVGTREGGACQAGAFIGEFTKGTPWVHLDIACVAKPDSEKPYRNGGVTGFGVRLVLEYLRSL